MDELEAAVIEAAQDLEEARDAAHYGPGGHLVKQAERALTKAVADLRAANDGRWKSPF